MWKCARDVANDAFGANQTSLPVVAVGFAVFTLQFGRYERVSSTTFIITIMMRHKNISDGINGYRFFSK